MQAVDMRFMLMMGGFDIPCTLLVTEVCVTLKPELETPDIDGDMKLGG